MFNWLFKEPELSKVELETKFYMFYDKLFNATHFNPFDWEAYYDWRDSLTKQENQFVKQLIQKVKNENIHSPG